MITDQHIEVILAVCNNTQFNLVPTDSMTFTQALMALKESHSKESTEVASVDKNEPNAKIAYDRIDDSLIGAAT